MSTVAPHTFTFPKTISLLDCEHIVDSIEKLDQNAVSNIKVSTNYTNKLFADLWVTIALGTILRRAPRSRVVAWGLSNKHQFDPTNFVARLPGLTSAVMAEKLLRDQSHLELSVSDVCRWIEEEKRGYVSDIRGTDRLIVEFDSKRASVLQSLVASDDEIDERAFSALLLQMRSELEIWAIGNDSKRESNKSAMDDISQFIKELFDNAYKHGRLGESLLQRMIPQLRFLRVRKIVEPSRQRLLGRTANTIPPIKEYVEEVMKGKTENALLEVCISDFGQGILDNFLSSPTGQRISKTYRQSTLERLLYENLTSQSHDPQAGLGLPKALDASRRLRAFVSLRTSEFWYARSFAHCPKDSLLNPVENRPHGRVSGTHWQFLWAPPE